jgi:hypothetical protein
VRTLPAPIKPVFCVLPSKMLSAGVVSGTRCARSMDRARPLRCLTLVGAGGIISSDKLQGQAAPYWVGAYQFAIVPMSLSRKVWTKLQLHCGLRRQSRRISPSWTALPLQATAMIRRSYYCYHDKPSGVIKVCSHSEWTWQAKVARSTAVLPCCLVQALELPLGRGPLPSP